MTYYDYLCRLLEPMRVYRTERGTLSGGELYAAGAVLDEVDGAMEYAEQEGVLQTAEGEGLARREKLFSRCPVSVSTALRREAIAALAREYATTPRASITTGHGLEGRVNVAMGAVLRLWHDAREAGVALPDEAALREAVGHVDMSQVILDEQAGTVYFADPELSLDLGAVAKGYTAERVAQWMLDSEMPSFIISAGGNVRCGQKPLDGRARWGVSIQDPGPIDGLPGTGYMDVLYLTNLSVVTSGDYQRYYTVDGVRYHHLIDPDTLYPGQHMRAVTIVTQDSGLADALSTAVFLMPYEQGRAFVEALDGVEAYWVLLDGSVQCTDGLRAMLASQGASSRD